MKTTALKKLALYHPYYCSDNNFYSREAGCRYKTANDFLDEWENTDEDLNLVFRWDVKEHDDSCEGGGFYANVFIMQQRKGIFYPVYIESITEEEVDRFKAYLQKHFELIKKLWAPLS